MKMRVTGLFVFLSFVITLGTASAAEIPAFAGPATPLPGYSYNKTRGDYWQFKDDRRLFAITAANLGQYANELSPGQAALFGVKPGYRMDVYPSRRDCGYPDWVAANSQRNETVGRLDPTGNYLEDAILPGFPFPHPKNGAQVLWNYLTRYRGVGIQWPGTSTGVTPRSGGSDWIMTRGPEQMYFPWGKKGQNRPADSGGLLYGFYIRYDEPPALAGQAIVQRYYMKDPVETYYYFPGQRRVRRMPTYQYDAPQIGYENNYTLDEPWLFNGPIDRFDWKILGKKELLVPYHAFGIYDFHKPFHEVAGDHFINPDDRRYELHRVWVVEGTVKPGVRHIAPRKVIYFDEDSFLALLGEDYDAQGHLWKVREGFSMPVWELGACDSEAFVQYDLLNGRYVFDQAELGQAEDMRWLPEQTDDARFTDNFYSSETLRSVSER
jgi:hypothetical protein